MPLYGNTEIRLSVKLLYGGILLNRHEGKNERLGGVPSGTIYGLIHERGKLHFERHQIGVI